MTQRDLKWYLFLPYKATFRPPLSHVRRLLVDFVWAWRMLRWRARLLQNNISIHGSIEIRGARNFQPHIRLGSGTVMDRNCTLWISDDPGNAAVLDLGANVYVACNCYLGAYQLVKIGDDCLIGAYSYITSGNHRFADLQRTIRSQGYTGEPVVLGKNVWVGCHVTILPGVNIGDGAVIGAGAVVTKSVPAGEIWAGVPAKKIGLRSEEKADD
jgi:serine acetyltransferase